MGREQADVARALLDYLGVVGAPLTARDEAVDDGEPELGCLDPAFEDASLARALTEPTVAGIRAFLEDGAGLPLVPFREGVGRAGHVARGA